MLEPQSTALFILLMVAFALLAWWMIRARQPVLRLLAACLAFLPAMVFGVVAVNKYYGYYTTWGAALADLGGQGGVGGSPAAPPGTVTTGTRAGTLTRSETYLRLAQQQGYTIRLTVHGRLSHLTRTVYAYLPPEYFQPSFRHYRFPVLELIHGQPGAPQDWINVVGVTDTLDRLVTGHHAKPVVLVMPDANGAENISLQCLNQARGPQDLTYLAQDLPQAITRLLRVQPPGPAWGIAGYSEGGFCAANMALRFRRQYGFAGVLSGYFKPAGNQLQDPFRRVSPFGGDARLQAENTPLTELKKLPAGTLLPSFWLATGNASKIDVTSTETFWQDLSLRQANVPLTLTPGGHNMGTWRKEVPAMLAWMTPRLAAAAWAAPARPGPRASVPGARSSQAPGTRKQHKFPVLAAPPRPRRAG